MASSRKSSRPLCLSILKNSDYSPPPLHSKANPSLRTTSGLFVYTILNALIGLVVFLSNNRIEPREYDLKEYWTWKGSGRPPWFVRAMRRDRSRVSPFSGDDQHNVVPPIAEENESQRGLNLQQSRDNPPGRDGSAAMGEQSMLPSDHDEAYGYHHHSSPMRGIAR